MCLGDSYHFGEEPRTPLVIVAILAIAVMLFIIELMSSSAKCGWCELYVSNIPTSPWIELPYLAGMWWCRSCSTVWLVCVLTAQLLHTAAALFYGTVGLVAHLQLRGRARCCCTIRPSVRGWAGMLFAAYLPSAVALILLNAAQVAFGFCLLDVAVLGYTGTKAYSPINKLRQLTCCCRSPRSSLLRLFIVSHRGERHCVRHAA